MTPFSKTAKEILGAVWAEGVYDGREGLETEATPMMPDEALLALEEAHKAEMIGEITKAYQVSLADNATQLRIATYFRHRLAELKGESL